jgi:hypothetical protein
MTGGDMVEQALSIVGSSRRHGERDKNDFYPTPPDATQALLDREKFEGMIWEPACGNGALSNVLSKNGYDVFSSDLIDRGFGFYPSDFLKEERVVCNIVTNPPFNLALEFVEHAKKIAKKKIAFFLKTTFLEGARRQKMFIDDRFPLKKVYQFSRRVRLDKNGIPMGCKSGMIAFAWFVWDKDHCGSATIDWIN